MEILIPIFSFIVLIALISMLRATFLPLERVTVYEYQKGLRYSGGRFVEVLPPGRHWRIWKSDHIQVVDVRRVNSYLLGQEVPSSDGVPVKISLAYSFSFEDVRLAFHTVDSYAQAVNMELQVALRNAVVANTIEDLMAGRDRMGVRISAEIEPKLREFGVKLESVNVRDIMVPGELKKMFAQVLKAQKEGLAALEKARGETAALRSLANAARMMEENPQLLNLRLLQTISETRGNTYVIGADKTLTVTKNPARSGPKSDVEA